MSIESRWKTRRASPGYSRAIAGSETMSRGRKTARLSGIFSSAPLRTTPISGRSLSRGPSTCVSITVCLFSISLFSVIRSKSPEPQFPTFRHHNNQFPQFSILIPPPSPSLSRPQLKISAVSFPHPDKVAQGMRALSRKRFGQGGEDAYFYTESADGKVAAMGVADGVYMWR